MPFWSLLEPPEALLGGLWTPKTFKNLRFFKVFENATFLVFEGLDGSLGLILPPSWADLVPKWPPKWAQKWSKNGSKSEPKKGPEKDPKMTPKWSPKSLTSGTLFSYFWGSFSGFGPRGLKMAPGWPTRAPRWLQTGPRQGQDRPR